MPDLRHNPFQAMEITVPAGGLHDEVKRYCQTGGSAIIDQMPFPRMVDLWFLAVCVAARLGLEPVDAGEYKTVNITPGSILSTDPWRVDALMLLAIGKTGDANIVSDPRKIMALANGLAAAGLPKVFGMLKDGNAEPIWNLSDAVHDMLGQGDSTR